MNTTRRTSRTLLPLAAVTALALGAAACGSDDETDSAASETADVSAVDGEVTVADAWSRQPAAGQSSAAIYGVVTNSTDETITAVSATSSVTDTVELHEVVMVDNEMSMREKEGGYEIAPGESLLFEPGGAHIMLLDIDPATYPDTIDIVLTFDDGTSIEFEAEVRALDGEDDMGDMDMGESDDMDDMDDMGESDDSDGHENHSHDDGDADHDHDDEDAAADSDMDTDDSEG